MTALTRVVEDHDSHNPKAHRQCATSQVTHETLVAVVPLICAVGIVDRSLGVGGVVGRPPLSGPADAVRAIAWPTEDGVGRDHPSPVSRRAKYASSSGTIASASFSVCWATSARAPVRGAL